MESEDEGETGDSSQRRIVKRLRSIKKKSVFGSLEPSVWTFSGVFVIFILLILTIMLLLPFGINPINRRAATVRSNSMEPTFARGDIVFIKDVDPQQVEEGDVIVLQVPNRYQEQYDYPPLVTHRVTDVKYDSLFDIDTSERDDLNLKDGEPTPDWLKNEFNDENHYLNNRAELTDSGDGVWWITIHGEKEYRLEDRGGSLRVFDATPAFETKGDAEDQTDPFLTPPQNIMGEYSGSNIPYFGLLFMFANTPIGMATLTLAFVLIVIAVYFPWHIDVKEERTRAMSTLGGGLDALHRRLTEMEEAMGSAASTVGESASGLIVSRTAEGNIAGVKKTTEGETSPDNIMMKRGEPGPEDIGLDVGKPSMEKEEKEGTREIDLRPLDELNKRFQKGELSVDEFIDMRKKVNPERERHEEIDLRPLNQLHKKFQRDEISVEEFIERRKNIMEGRKDG
ncbi:MAG: signal peptidase I [Candidatus Natronoplasma sp.]